MVPCLNSAGQIIFVEREQLRFGVAVYGLLIENHRVLLVRHPATGLWEPPGGQLARGQAPEAGMRSLFRAQSGLLTDLDERLLLEEENYVDSAEQAWQLAVLYYALRRSPGSTLTAPPSDENRPTWVRLSELRRGEMQRGYDAVQSARQRLETDL